MPPPPPPRPLAPPPLARCQGFSWAPLLTSDDAGLDPLEMLQTSRDKPLPGIVEQVVNGSVLRLTLLPDFHPINVMVAGVQAPSMGRRPPPVSAPAESTANGDTSKPAAAPTTAASVAAAASSSGAIPPPPPPLPHCQLFVHMTHSTQAHVLRDTYCQMQSLRLACSWVCLPVLAVSVLWTCCLMLHSLAFRQFLSTSCPQVVHKLG